MSRLLDDNSGQAIPIEYILIFTISMIFFGLMVLTFGTVIDNSSRQAIYTEFTDIGNDVSLAITHIYLSTPVNGRVNTTLNIPTEVAGSGYFIEISEDNPHEQDKMALKLTSIHKDVTVYIPLNSVDKVANINGSASSASGEIIISRNITAITLYQG